MSKKTITIAATNGSTIKYIDEVIETGAMKDVYFSPDKSYVVAFFRDKQDANAKIRLEMIPDTYFERIFNNVGGKYWKELFCWSTKIVDHEGKIGVVMPTYNSHFFFTYGSKRPNLKNIKPSYLPWADVSKIPYTVCGPYLKALFDKAFITALHQPHLRPAAAEWEQALVKTIDLVQPCQNPKCEQGWFVFDNTTAPVCPFCKTPYNRQLPVLNLYSSRSGEKFIPDNHRLMVYDKQYIYKWHISRNISPNERLSNEDKKPVGYFVFHQSKWVLVNQRMPDLKDVDEDKPIPVNTMVELKDNQKLLLSEGKGGRLLHVQIVNQ